MIFSVTDTGFQTDDPDELIQYCIEDDYHDDEEEGFEDWVNDNYNSYEICGKYSEKEYLAYDILHAFGDEHILLDDYRERLNEEDIEDARWHIQHAGPEYTFYIQKYQVVCIEDEEPGEDTDGDEAMDAIQVLRMEIQKQKEENEKEARHSDETFANYLDLFQKLGH